MYRVIIMEVINWGMFFMLGWSIGGLVWFGGKYLCHYGCWRKLFCFFLGGPFTWILGACSIALQLSLNWFEKRLERKTK